MQQETITCINCPIGCRMTVTHEGQEVLSIQGNSCKRGETYARQECIAPMRVITASAPVCGRDEPISVKTRQPVPKEKISDCMRAILAGHYTAPIRIGDVLLKNVCDTGVDVIATRSVQ